ncbi:hypothetical protein G4B88_004665 [Cannabis sativa]|uniref:Uncharacterized protein n=1 Tax=Cannabis sativa TaxID=3483 RepID=A0A7J6DWR0_CANSA|nr:hypothetical protein G4B88_000311 [Cannabis sativa]KAF4374914.1 hypothetical protein G4B88_004665 [Cannabis sativa]
MQIQSRQEMLTTILLSSDLISRIGRSLEELMKGIVAVGEELMPHRGGFTVPKVASPVRNISRNRTVAVAE